MDTMFDDLHGSLEHNGDGGNRFHTLSQGLREEVERLSRKDHQWESYNVDQLVSGVPPETVPINMLSFLIEICPDVGSR